MKSDPIVFLSGADPVLQRLIQKFGPLKIQKRYVPPYQSLIHAIAHQQLTGKAANTILKRFQGLFGNTHFPSADEILLMDVGRICSVGFSRSKAMYVHGVAQRAVSGFIPAVAECQKLSDSQILDTLTQIKGVGRWTAEMFLMFSLGRPDVLPIHDYGLRKGFQIAYHKRRLPEPQELEKYGMKWRPYRTTASLYLYRAADFLKDGEW